MKITILQEKLKEGFGLVERIVPRSATLPVLNNILLKTEKNFLNLTATDLEMVVNWWALAKVEEEGEMLLPSQTILPLVSLFPNKPINIRSKKLTIDIECADYKSSLKTLNSEEFPIIPSVSGADFLEMPASSLSGGLSQVAGVAAPSTVKPEISGVYFAVQPGESIKMAATDSFRLAEKTIALKEKSGNFSQHTFILPQRAAREIINIFGQRKGNVKIYFSPTQILFEAQMEETNHPQIQFTSRLIEGDFPNYQEIIPKKYETQAIFPQREFLNQVKSAGVFSGKSNEIRIKINSQKGEAQVVSQNPDLGEYESRLASKIEGKDVEIIFNYKFLIDGLLNIGDEVALEVAGDEGPAVLKPAKGGDYIYILMPIKKS